MLGACSIQLVLPLALLGLQVDFRVSMCAHMLLVHLHYDLLALLLLAGLGPVAD